MYGLRHKRLTHKKDAGSGGSIQTGRSPSGIQSKKVDASMCKGRVATSTRKNGRSANDTAGRTKRSSTAATGGSAEKGSTAAGSAGRCRIAAFGSEEMGSVAATAAARSDGKSCTAAVGNDEMGSARAATGNTERSNADVNAERSNAANVDVDNTETRSANADGNIERRISAAGVHSERTSAVRGDDDACGRTSALCGGVNSSLNIGSKRGSQEPAKRGRAKMARTELAVPPRSGRVVLEPVGHNQFKYIGYNPKGYKYPSQVGVILKREYPGIIKVYDDDGTIVKRQPAFSWNDYYWKKDEHGICYAKKVKAEFWSLFTCHPKHRRQAEKNLENYLVRRVPNMMHQVRLEAVKMFCNKHGEDCDDTRARTILLTEEQYLSCRIGWCNKAVWAWLSEYWTSEQYKQKRERAQEARMRSDDPAPNRGGSRNFTETQQFLEYTFGLENSGTINTYAVMKSGMKRVDSTGRSGPIPSAKAQKRLDDYKALVPDETSHQLDGKALYTIGRGMAHGRVPIGDGAVEKAAVLRHAKSSRVIPISPDKYEQVKKENVQLKENNELLHEENSVHRELLMAMFETMGTEPPPDLLQRLANIDARRHQATGSSHGYDGEDNNANLEDDDDDDHTWCGSESDDDLDSDVHGIFEADSDDDLEEYVDDISDEDHYSDHVSGDHISGGRTGSREIDMPTDGSGTRETN